LLPRAFKEQETTSKNKKAKQEAVNTLKICCIIQSDSIYT